ncbi:MAG: hypothetical protein KC561_11840 [Myxococcales bacterium]|nr:hypothetical protein [Myxococcales bacterium]
MKRRLSALTLLAGVLFFAGSAIGQVNLMGTPTYGTFALNTGFMPDPTNYQVTAGGTIQSSTLTSALGSPCNAGWIASVPDVRINYTAGTLPLRFYVDSDADTTLAVNTPDGAWHCNDDSVGLDPVIDFATPMSGQYDIFIGTFSQSNYPTVNLSVTELPSTNGPGMAGATGQMGQMGQTGQAGAAINVMGTPTYGTFTVNSGFTPDPQSYAVTAGGTAQASSVTAANGGPCNAGWIATTPDIRVNYTSGSFPLRFYVSTPATDTTLAVNAPDGSWYCNDDTVGLHPVIDFPTPMSGQYDIFVGTFSQSDFPNVTLFVTELPASNGPTP